MENVVFCVHVELFRVLIQVYRKLSSERELKTVKIKI